MRVYKLEYQEVYKTKNNIKYFTSYIKCLRFLETLLEVQEIPLYKTSEKSNIEDDVQWILENFELLECGTDQLIYFGSISCIKIF